MDDTTRPPDDEMGSRTRPRKLPPRGDIVALARALRLATRDYVAVLEGAITIMPDEVIAGRPELAYLRSMLYIATGKRGNAPFATPAGLDRWLSQLLGEQEAENPPGRE